MKFVSGPETVYQHVVSIFSEIVVCDSWLEGSYGALDFHIAADPGADRTSDSTGGCSSFDRGDNTAEQIVAVQQIQEQKVEVIKVILQEQCPQKRFFF